MPTSIALFTRDLRILDNPVLTAAARSGPVIPLFVLDDRLLERASPNRRWALADGLADLRLVLREAGGDLVVRRGDTVEVVRDLAVAHGVDEVHVARDVSPFAAGRERRLREALGWAELVLHDSHGIVEPGVVTPASSDHYRVFTPYFRAWAEAPRREVLPPVSGLTLPAALEVGDLPDPDELAGDDTSPELVTVAETPSMTRALGFVQQRASDYDDARDEVAVDGTSRLSGALHYGTISARWLEEHLDLEDEGHESFWRQLCWRDYSRQLLAANRSMVDDDLRTKDDAWLDDPEGVEAWKQGRTGYPLVDAGMRQLLAEGWMHNRVRMVVASFLTKSMYVDWRIGADHFERWLVDADVANNRASWQWVAGTGTDSRPNRVLNPVRQAERFDPTAAYIRRWVPELRSVEDDRLAREPWQQDGLADQVGYVRPIVELDEARERFLAARGA